MCAFLPAECVMKKLILFSDVDGVIRESVEDERLDEDVCQAIENLLATQKAEIIFISGSPCIAQPIEHPWQEDNCPLYDLFYEPFKKWMEIGLVSVYGAQGGQRLTPEGACELHPKHTFTVAEKEALYAVFIQAYCEGASRSASGEEWLPEEWLPMAKKLFLEDSGFRLIDRGSEIELQATLTGWDLGRAYAYLEASVPNFSVVAGSAKRGLADFYFLKASCITKEACARSYMQAKDPVELAPETRVVAFGDTQTDIGLYKVAQEFGGDSFHFGRAGDYEGNPLTVLSEEGKDHSHTKGACRILRSLAMQLAQ